MPEKRTYAHRAEYLKKAVAKRRKRLKEMVVEYKGGKCVICGYNRYAGAFDLHHLDESKKRICTFISWTHAIVGTCEERSR